ncbi:MAG: glycosyl transferase, partial [Lachnospiraceae bacterium]|nr:glycosyl transferase [Lachnospiraceae bacterium]
EQKGYTQTQAYNVLYSGGLNIYTTQDMTIQKICDEEVNNPANYPMATTYSVNWAWSVTKSDGTVQNYSDADLEYYEKVVLGKNNFKLIFSSPEECDAMIEDFKAEYLQEGDEVLEENKEYTIQPQTSFTVMDQKTGYVKAMTGGRGEKTGSLTLNRAANTKRQPGSCFKVLAAYAPALDTAGYTLASTINDSPFYDVNGRPVKNWWGNSYRGMSTLRQGIYDSMNVVTSKLLTEITPQLGFDYVENFGITTLVASETLADGSVVSDINQALCLGGITYGVKNIELCAAYAAIANAGVYIEPVYYTKVLDHNGKVVMEPSPTVRTVIKDSTAWLLTNAMEDVVKKGTGKACAVNGMSVAGKTGTTSNDYDLWFAGYTPYLTATVWLGYDENASLANYGAVHEKLWSKIVTRIDEAKGYTEDLGFPPPESVFEATVCKTSGKLANGGCPTTTEYFAKGTVPAEYCNIHSSRSYSEKTDSSEHTESSNNSSESSGGVIVVTGDDEADSGNDSNANPDVSNNPD